MTLRFASNLLAVFIIIQGGCMSAHNNDEVLFSFSEGFYVRGHKHDGDFTPHGEVMGSGELGTAGQPGWMELSSGQFHPMHAAQSPKSPYVNGFMTSNGFVPSTREIR